MELNKFAAIKDIHLFIRKLCLKTLHYKQDMPDKGMEKLLSLSQKVNVGLLRSYSSLRIRSSTPKVHPLQLNQTLSTSQIWKPCWTLIYISNLSLCLNILDNDSWYK